MRWGCMRRFRTPTAFGALVLMLLGACSEGDQSSDAPGPIAPSSVTAIPGGSTLIARTTPPENGIGRAANVSGVLDLNKAKCFTISGRILVAPYGSSIVDDGAAVDLEGYGRFEVGETVHAGGGTMPAARPEVDPAWRDCIVNKKRDLFVIINSTPVE